jgi:solute carrier family 35 protein F1/2
MWGTIINGIQASSLEHYDMTQASWNGATIGFLVAYTAGKHSALYWRSINFVPLAMFLLYTTAPLLYRSASSAFYNISLLTSDFYGLLFGV